MSLFRRSERVGGPDSLEFATQMSAFQSWDGWNSTSEKVAPSFESYVRDGYQQNGIIFSVILARLMLFSEAEFKWQSLSDKRLYGDQSLALLEQPWPGGSTGELLARMEQDVSLAGNSFIVRGQDRLYRLRPDKTTIVSEILADGLGREFKSRVGYMYAESVDSGPVFYGVDEVAHWSPIPDPAADFRGMSWLTPVVREIDADSDLTKYKIRYLENAATPNLLIRYEQVMTPDVLDELRKRFGVRHEGVDNAFKTLVLDRGADATVIGSTLEQLNFTTVQAAGENRIAAAGGVPGIVVGLKEGLQAATYSNYEQAMRRFSDLTMRPLWRSACAALSQILPPPAGSRLWFDVAGIAALRQGELERSQTFQVKANTVGDLIQNGYDPASVASAVEAGDLSLLVHSGNMPGQQNSSRQLSAAELIQKLYLGVGKVITVDEARTIVSQAGVSLGPIDSATLFADIPPAPTPGGATA